MKTTAQYQKEYEARHKHPCPLCGKPIFRTVKGPCRECSIKLGVWAKPKREASILWKGGRHKNPAGYILVYHPEYYRAYPDGSILEHIYVWEQVNGKLSKGWHIHHLNSIKGDNRLENLFALPPQTHRKHWGATTYLLKAAQRRIKQLENQLANQSHF